MAATVANGANPHTTLVRDAFLLLACLVFVPACQGEIDAPIEAGVVAMVDGAPIRESDIELTSVQQKRMEESIVPREHLNSWEVAIKKDVLRRTIWDRLEASAMENVQVDLSQRDYEAEFQSHLRTYTAGGEFDTYEEFAEHVDTVRRARIAYLENPAAAEDIYAEMLQPAGIGRDALDFDTTLIDVEALENSEIPMTREALRAAYRETFEHQARRAKLFGVDLEVTEPQRSAYLTQHRGLSQTEPEYEHAIDNMIREELLAAARTRWLADAVQDADIRIIDSRFADINLNPEDEP